MRAVRGRAGGDRNQLKTRIAWRIGYLVASVGIYLTDQASKAWAVRRLRFADSTIIRGILDFAYAENRGGRRA